MVSSLTRASAAVIIFVAGANAFSATANNNLAMYWGQNSAGTASSQGTLASYCNDATLDIIPISFLDQFFGPGGLPTVNFASACSGPVFPGSQLLQCSQIGQDIKTCQAKGKKILLSLGGASGAYGFTTQTQAVEFADLLWNLFSGGQSSTRPFGDAVVDGFDLDIEGGSSQFYGDFANRMRTHYDAQSVRQYYLAAAPQCPFPDAFVSPALSAAKFDFIFVQFYNNYCGINTWIPNTPTNFNFDSWDKFAKSAPNPNVKVYLGVPASQSAAGSGYVSSTTLASAAKEMQSKYSSFGGIMMWDASQAWANVPAGQTRNYAQLAKDSLGGSAAPGQPAAASAPAPSSSSTTTTTRTSTSTSTTTSVIITSSVVGTPISTSISPTTTPIYRPAVQSSSSTPSGQRSATTQASCPVGCVPDPNFVFNRPNTPVIVPAVPGASAPASTACPVSGGDCATGSYQCAGLGYAQCVFGKWVIMPCGTGLGCAGTGSNIYCDFVGSASVTCAGITGKIGKREVSEHDLNETLPEFDMDENTLDAEVKLSMRARKINAQDFVATLTAIATGIMPITADWSFTFSSEKYIRSTDRGILTNNGKGSYTVSSVPNEEVPSRKVVVQLMGTNDPPKRKRWFH